MKMSVVELCDAQLQIQPESTLEDKTKALLLSASSSHHPVLMADIASVKISARCEAERTIATFHSMSTLQRRGLVSTGEPGVELPKQDSSNGPLTISGEDDDDLKVPSKFK